MTSTPKVTSDLLSGEKAKRFLEDEAFNQSTSTPAWDLERSTPMGTLKNMIRLHHTANTSKDKNIVLGQILKIEEGFEPLYIIAEGQDTENKSQLVRFRVLSDRRHYWIPEPKSSADHEKISLHPLAKHNIPVGETASPLKVGDIVDIQMKDVEGQYSSYLDTAVILGKSGHMNNIGDYIPGRRCTNVTLPPLPSQGKDSDTKSMLGDPCLIVGNMKDFNMEDVKANAAANKKDIVFPRYPVDAPYKVNSQWGKIRNLAHYKRPRPHLGTDYECSIDDAILAPLAGKVVVARPLSGYGNVVVIKHTQYSIQADADPVVFYTLFAHLGTNSKTGILVSVGQQVTRSQTIATGGNSGVKTKGPGDGSHLHFEYLVDPTGIKTVNQMLQTGSKRQVSKDPETDFFRRAFFTDTTAAKKNKKNERQKKGLPRRGTKW